MRKNLSLIILALLMITMLLPLSACHGSKGLDNFVIPDEFDMSKQYEIDFWAKNDTNIAQTNIYKKAIEDFQSIYPNIKVNLKLYSDYGRIYNDVITNITTNTTPNVCITYPDHIATYLSGSNTVVPLNELMVDEKYGLGGSEIRFDAPTKDEIVPEFLEECRLDDYYYALPYMRSTEALYINKDLLNRMGYEVPDVLTWDFVFKVSEEAMEMDEDEVFKLNGQKVLIPFIYKSTDNMMISMLKQLDAGYSTEEGEIEIFNETTKKILLEVASHAKSYAFSTFKISSYPGNFLNAGQCIFAIDSTAGATWMGSKAPLSDIAEDKKVDFETVVRMIPQYDVENPKMISQGPSVCIFNKADNDEVLASWIFTQYLLSNEVQISYSQTEGYVPVTMKAQNTEEYRQYLADEGKDDTEHYDIKIKAAKLLLENQKNTFVTPVFLGSASLRDAAGQMIEEVCKGVRRKKDVNEDFIDNLYLDMKSLYRLNQVGKNKIDFNNTDNLGPLPPEAIALLVILGAVWVCIVIYTAKEKIREKKLQSR